MSNMPVAQVSSLDSGLERVHFAATPKMSTYLLFFSIGDYERVHRYVDGTDVGVMVKRGDLPKAGYALDQAATLLHYYNVYFGVRYPLPKLRFDRSARRDRGRLYGKLGRDLLLATTPAL